MTTYAIGDIYGMYNLLFDLANKIKEDMSQSDGPHKVIFLGDYVDRGPDSAGVIDFIKGKFFNPHKVVALMGNHEDMMLAGCNIKGFHGGEYWIPNGGTHTINSYGGNIHDIYPDHINWLKKLPLYHVDNKFLFVHAGIDPFKKLTLQSKNDLLWIRQPWLSYRGDYYGFKVVHGHTPTTYLNKSTKPDVQTNSVCIDTGSSHSGILTAMVIPDTRLNDFSFIQARDIVVNNSFYIRHGYQ